MKKLSSFTGFLLVLFCFGVTAVAAKLPENFVLKISEPEKLVYLAVSPDSQTVAVRGPDYIQLWNIADQTLIKTIPNQESLPPNSSVKDMQFTPDGKNLVERFYYAPQIVVTNIETGKVVFEKTLGSENNSEEVDIRFSPSGNNLLICDKYRGEAHLIEMKTWKALSTTFVGLAKACFFIDEETILVRYEDVFVTYKLGEEPYTLLELNAHLGYMIQMSPTKYISRTSMAALNCDASLADIETNTVKRFYQNDIPAPDGSPEPWLITIHELHYNAANNVLLVGTTSSDTPKGLRLVDMATLKASPPFNHNNLKEIKFFNNDKENHIVGINRGEQNPEQGGVQFIKALQ